MWYPPVLYLYSYCTLRLILREKSLSYTANKGLRRTYVRFFWSKWGPTMACVSSILLTFLVSKSPYLQTNIVVDEIGTPINLAVESFIFILGEYLFLFLRSIFTSWYRKFDRFISLLRRWMQETKINWTQTQFEK